MSAVPRMSAEPRMSAVPQMVARGCRRAAVLLSCVLCAQFAVGADSAGPAAPATLKFRREFGAAFLDGYWRRHTDFAIYEGYYRVGGLCRCRVRRLAAKRSSFCVNR